MYAANIIILIIYDYQGNIAYAYLETYYEKHL